MNPDTQEEDTRPTSDNAPFSALAFKIITDPFVGKLTFFRVYSGQLASGSYVLNSTKGHRERISRILQMHANTRQELDAIFCGDLAAGVGLKSTTTGDTLCDEKSPIILEAMDFPAAMADMLPQEMVTEMWVDGDDLPRKFSQTLELPAQAGGTGSSSTSEGTYSDYGTEVQIEAPPADQVTEDLFPGAA